MAVTKYLDKTGLTYFWSKIKAWCNSVFALDSNVVHKIGNEIINGTKTFSQNIVIDKTSSVLTLKANDIDTAVVSNEYYFSHAVAFNDKNDIAIKNRIGMIRAGRSDYDANFIQIAAISPVIDSIDNTSMSVFYYRNGLTKAIAPSTLSNDDLGNLSSSTYLSGRDILTRDWIPKDTRIVHTTSNETIGGTKTFSSSPIAPTPTTSDNSTKVATTAFVKAQGYLTSHQTLPTLSVTTSGDGNAVTGISVNNHAITVNKSLTFLTSHQSLSNYVTLTGAQTLSGQKTFTSSPITTGRWYCNREDPSLQLNYTEYTKGATLSSATNAGIFIHDKTADTAEKTRLGAIRHWIDTSRSSCMRIGAYRDVKDSTEVAILSVTCDYDGTKYASCPTPADNENSTKIATTAWVQKFCSTTKGYLTSHQTLPNLSISTSGSGNAVTSVTVSGHAITVNKNTTFLTAHQSLANYLTKLTNVSEMGKYIDMHYDNDTAAYNYDARIFVNTQGNGDGKGELKILASKVTSTIFNGNLTGNADTATALETARTINGVSFDGSANIDISDFTRIFWSIGAYNKHASAVKGTNPSSTQYWSFGMTDKNGYADENTLGRLRTTLATDGTVSTYITAFKNIADSTASVSMGVRYDVDGTSGYTFAPTPATSDNSTKIATTAFVKAQGYLTSHQTLPTLSLTTSGSGNAITALSVSDHAITVTKGSTFLTSHQSLANYVTLNGTQTITGVKTFTSKVTIKSSDVTKATAPASNFTPVMIEHNDSEGRRLWGIYYNYNTDKTSYVRLIVNNGTTTSNAWTGIGVGYDKDGDWFTYAPTPATADSSTNIATTAFVKAQGYLTSHQSLANYVTLDGTQTISGAKTITGGLLGINKDNSTDDANILYSTTVGTKLVYYTTTIGGTKLTNIPAALNTTLESRTLRRVSASDWCADQICHNTNGLYYRLGTNSGWTAWREFAFTDHTHDYLPLTGGSLTGNIKLNTTSTVGIYKGNATSFTEFSGGSALNKGARLALYGESHSTNAGRFDLIAANTSTSKSFVGTVDGNLKWGGTTIHTSSDARLKTPLSDVPQEILDAWENVSWGQFQYLEAKNIHGDDARLHMGLIAQDVDNVFFNKNLDACRYGILCYDIEDDLWSIRYAEALAMEAAYQRHKNKILENRISELEKQVSDMIILLQNLTNSNG